jgi:AraC-like DNA-binding protein
MFMDEMNQQLQTLASLIDAHFKKGESAQTLIPALYFFCNNTTSEFSHAMYEPSLCMIAQGSKVVLVGDETYPYNKNSHLITSVHLPARVQILEASPEKPYLGLKVRFSMSQILDILKDMKQSPDSEDTKNSKGLYIDTNTPLLLDAILRLVRLCETPQDIAIVAPLIIREILYRIVHEKGGVFIKQFAQNGTLAQRVSKAIGLIKNRFSEPLYIDSLAREVDMSIASLHKHFKRITTMSPLQFQKNIRLQEARKLLLVSGSEAASVAFEVGYESPSQFSREYTRMFGISPMRDVLRRKESLLSVSDEA